MTGTLYIVATPIGNLADITARALQVLREADCIAAEDTRHSARLMQAHGISTPMLAYHDFNEERGATLIMDKLEQGCQVALITDAGTPLVSDPGFRLVRLARQQGVRVVPVPGPSAVIAALSVAGLPSDRFAFEGFLPAREGARTARLESLLHEPRTMIFYEAPHRIVECLENMCQVFGGNREVVLARELTKTYETIIHESLEGLLGRVSTEPDQQKGEMVLLVAGAGEQDDDEVELRRIMQILLEDLPLKQAAVLGAKLTGAKKNRLYELGLELAGKKD
jgi:16S rRNA (cytidine1402-2'-O)-methyltransferase